MPMEGMTYEKMGFDPIRQKQMMKRLQEAANPLGLKFSDGREFAANTIMSHLLTEYAETFIGLAKQNEIADRLLKGYFSDNAKMDEEYLLRVASDVGMDTQDVARYITNVENQKLMRKKAMSWSEKGISSVPYFIMNGVPSFSGAQDSNVFKSAILKVSQKHPLPQEKKKPWSSSL